MIRVALIVIGFLGVTLSLILMQPKAPVQTTAALPAPPQDVTRAEMALDDAVSLTGTGTATTPLPEPEPKTAAAPQPAPLPVTPSLTPSALESMIVTALREGQNDHYIDALVNDAAARGAVDVPAALVTADGRVDTATLLTVLSRAPDALRAGGTLYTVQPGDSLASISYRFYGTTDSIAALQEANSTSFASTGLSPGQELVIPPK